MTSNISHIERLFEAIDKLPDEGRALMRALYCRGMTEEQVCAELNIDSVELDARRSRNLRALMLAVH